MSNQLLQQKLHVGHFCLHQRCTTVFRLQQWKLGYIRKENKELYQTSMRRYPRWNYVPCYGTVKIWHSGVVNWCNISTGRRTGKFATDMHPALPGDFKVCRSYAVRRGFALSRGNEVVHSLSETLHYSFQ